MKAIRRVALYFLGLSLIFSAGNFPLWGEEDYLGNFGVYRFDTKNDAPKFTLPDLTGRERALSEFRGKLIMLNFWATW